MGPHHRRADHSPRRDTAIVRALEVLANERVARNRIAGCIGSKATEAIRATSRSSVSAAPHIGRLPTRYAGN
jgi:hypothetical protein